MTQTQTPDYRKPREWVNFGDINPELHGGLWVKWDNDMWHIIETYHPEDLPEDFAKGRFYFEHIWLEEMDIWVEGKPENGFTEWALDQLDSFSNAPFDPMPGSELPQGETMGYYMNWVIENHCEWLIGSLAFAYAGYYGGHESDLSENYWEYLARYDISPDMA